METNSQNYIFKFKEFIVGDTITCIYQRKQFNGFVVNTINSTPASMMIVVNISRQEFIKSYIQDEKPTWEATAIMEPMFFSFRIAPSRCVLTEKNHVVFGFFKHQ